MTRPIAIVSGAVANKCGNGGEAWIRLSWTLGLKRLGFDVCFVEQIPQSSCVDASGSEISFAASANLAWFQAVMNRFGLANSCALIYENGQEVWGLGLDELIRRAGSAELLVNISGHLILDSIKQLPRCKVFVDEDPGFTQMWQANRTAGAHLDGHDFYFTLGQNIGTSDCAIPTVGILWRHIHSPIVLDQWPLCGRNSFDRFTTVASWRGAYGPVQYGGKTYGVKAHEFRKLFELPRRSGKKFEIALHIDPADKKDLDALHCHGWRILDPREVADSPDAFRQYVQNSSAEFSVAQGMYVDTNSGWFSDRTVRYLASGRPALVQDTGFTHQLPVGQGLLAFQTLDEAVEQAGRLVDDYEKHCWAARQLAEEYFDSDKVIRRVVAITGVSVK